MIITINFFDFLDKDKLYLSDIDKTAIDICKRIKVLIRMQFIKEMNKINAKYDLKKHLPKLKFEFENKLRSKNTKIK